VKELWQLVKDIEPFELLTCRDCPHFRVVRCPKDERDPDAVECSPRTDTRQALHYLERELESTGQRKLF